MVKSNFLPHDRSKLLKNKEQLLEDLRQMLRIRNFEVRAEGAYQHGKIGGFFHSYMGQEAVQVAALRALGPNHWWITSYRCHALALLLGASADELMAELFGKATGNAKGRGGSMHFFTSRMLGGFGIVGGQIPVATGAAFTIKYLKQEGEIAICFLGDGAVAQGAFHESLNLASLWQLPCLYVIENNLWGMGTSVKRALAVSERLAEARAPAYGMKGYTLDGMDYFSCLSGFSLFRDEILRSGEPILVEVITERFRGHSISDPAHYRSKEELMTCMMRDPIILMRDVLIQEGLLTEEEFKELDKAGKQEAIAALDTAEKAPWPDPVLLEQDVFAS